jgi:hypothetical protein
MPSDCWKNEGDYATKQAERTAWFNKIAPQPNWKAPIDAVGQARRIRRLQRGRDLLHGIAADEAQLPR